MPLEKEQAFTVAKRVFGGKYTGNQINFRF